VQAVHDPATLLKVIQDCGQGALALAEGLTEAEVQRQLSSEEVGDQPKHWLAECERCESPKATRPRQNCRIKAFLPQYWPCT
jgi:hypothetical protein